MYPEETSTSASEISSQRTMLGGDAWENGLWTMENRKKSKSGVEIRF